MHYNAVAFSVRMEINSLRPHADMFLLNALNASGPAALEPLMRALTWLGDYWRIPFYSALLLAMALVRRRAGDISTARSWSLAALVLAIGLPVSASLTAGLKEAIAAPRPSALLGPDAVRVLAEVDSEFSFPSGHSASAALIVSSLLPLLPAWGRAIAIILALCVGASRVWLGVHFPSDVLAGLAIGAAVGAASGFLVRRMLCERP